VILCVLLATPALVSEVEADLERLECSTPQNAALRDVVLRHHGAGPAALEEAAQAAIGPAALDALRSRPHLAINPALRAAGDVDKARQTVGEELRKLFAARGHQAEIAEAEEDIIGFADEAVTWRLAHAADARNAALSGVEDDRTEYETGPNGARISKRERDAFADMLDRIGYQKPGRSRPG